MYMLQFLLLIHTSIGSEFEGLEWPGWESQNPQRVVKLMEEVEEEDTF
jgi:hypothetical protein